MLAEGRATGAVLAETHAAEIAAAEAAAQAERPRRAQAKAGRVDGKRVQPAGKLEEVQVHTRGRRELERRRQRAQMVAATIAGAIT